MSYRWYLVKYMQDPFRAEPRNIGVVVVGEDEAGARFIGEVDGRFDGRKVKGVVSSAEVLRSWINYLRTHLQKGTFEKVLTSLSRRSLDNYVIEPRGTLLEIGTPEDLIHAVDTLFVELVSVPMSSNGAALEEKVDRILFRQLKPPKGHEIEKDVSYQIPLKDGGRREVHFDYRYTNGNVTLLDKVSLLGPERAVEQRINDLLFRIEHVYSEAAASFITFYDSAQLELSRRADRQIMAIEKYSHIVDANAENAAVLVGEQLDVPAMSDA